MFYAINIFTNERTCLFDTEEEIDECLASWPETEPVRFDVYHDGRLAWYAWNRRYFEEYIAPMIASLPSTNRAV